MQHILKVAIYLELNFLFENYFIFHCCCCLKTASYLDFLDVFYLEFSISFLPHHLKFNWFILFFIFWKKMRQLFIKIFISLIFTVIASYVCYDTIVGSSFKINGRISTHLLFDTTNDVNGKYLPISNSKKLKQFYLRLVIISYDFRISSFISDIRIFLFWDTVFLP